MRASTLALTLLVLPLSAAHAQMRYHAVPLPEHHGFMPGAMSPGGAILGVAHDGTRQYAARVQGSSIVDVSGGLPEATIPFAINDQGAVVGAVMSGARTVPFLATPESGFATLSPLGGLYGYATGISDSRVVVGYASVPDDHEASRPFRWEDGAAVELPLPPGFTHGFATGISPSGAFISGAVHNEQLLQPLLWSADGFVLLPSPAEGRVPIPLAVNDAGAAVGICSTDLGNAACLWQNGSVVLLSPECLVSGLAINADSQVVVTNLCQGIRGVTWINGTRVDLTTATLGDVLVEFATAIDDAGNVAAYGKVPGQPDRGFLLTPVCPADFDADGLPATEADIGAFFNCLAGDCCGTCPLSADIDQDGDTGTDADIEMFFSLLNSSC